MWQYAKSATEPESKDRIDRLKTLNKKIWRYFNNIDKTECVKHISGIDLNWITPQITCVKFEITRL